MICRQIASRLKSSFEHLNNENESRQHTSDSMSLSDKMELWGRKLGQNNLEVAEGDLFEGVEDEKDDDGDLRNPEVSTYGKTIISSTAYRWLISSLLMETSFHWDGSQPLTMLNAVRHPILEKLPKGTISRRNSPPLYTAGFLLSWPPIQLRIEQDHMSQHMAQRRLLSEMTVITGSSAHQIQATTVKQYLSQTWSSGGEALLNAIQGVVDGSYAGVYSGKSTTNSWTSSDNSMYYQFPHLIKLRSKRP